MKCRSLAFAVFIASCSQLQIFADVTGAISGTVRDSSQAVVAHATVTATETATTFTRSTVSDNNGEFRLLALPPGQYNVSATASGFGTFLSRGIDLKINDQLRVDVILQIGTVQEAVTVEANAVQV